MPTIEQIAKALSVNHHTCNVANLALHWPKHLEQMKQYGDDSINCQIAALATIAVETAWHFEPIQEFDNHDHTYLKSKKYWPYFGRGTAQLTWDYNYLAYGKAIGVDLIAHPELALEPDNAAKIFALFFRDKHIGKWANEADWPRVRKLWNGGYNAFDEYVDCITNLVVLFRTEESAKAGT